ncbi:DNA repair exonuclease [Paenibacillus sp. YN15]|uniref:metallophosphoesterase family protein n=1 Tax=Paenibacillus sp. YN15 TaxID=1742774 RepID=UPI000DCF0243|nr:DNA repair exonuclease [Paenibacillus sp. YN15]RAU92098.1 DNA repair exonuclease [Paenibacillus sp. YN15]
MIPFRFIHAADLHLDSPFAGLSGVPEPVSRLLRGSTFAALDNLTELAIREKADFVLIAGDVYDSADRSLKAQLRFHRAMKRLAENGISAFVVHGNHDPLDGREARLDWPGSVHVFKAGEAEHVPVVLAGRGHVADIQGISYPTAAVRENYALRFGRGTGGVYQIGLLHANVDGSPEHEDYAPCSLRELGAVGLDYWALGHVHTRRVLSEGPWVVYPGNLQGRSIRETGAKGCYVVEVDETGRSSLRFQALDAVRWLNRQVSIADCSTEQELKEALERAVEDARAAAEGRPSVLRIVLAGRGKLHGRLQGGFARDLAEELRRWEQERWGLEEAAGGFGFGEAPPLVWLEKLVVRTGVAADREALLQAEGFLGELLRLAAELEGEPQALQVFAKECMEPLLAHHRAGALMRRTGLAADGGAGTGLEAGAAAELLKQASEWLLDHLLDEEEGA